EVQGSGRRRKRRTGWCCATCRSSTRSWRSWTTDDPWLLDRGAEVLGPVGAVGAAGGVADADLAVTAVEDVRPVTGAVHPGGDHAGRRRLAGGDVLRGRGEPVAGRVHPVERAQPAQAVVGEVVAGRHVRAVRLR